MGIQASDFNWVDVFTSMFQVGTYAQNPVGFEAKSASTGPTAPTTPAGAGVGAGAGNPTAPTNTGKPGEVSPHPEDGAAATRQEGLLNEIAKNQADQAKAQANQLKQQRDMAIKQDAQNAFQKFGGALNERPKAKEADERARREIDERVIAKRGLSKSSTSGDIQATKDRLGIP